MSQGSQVAGFSTDYLIDLVTRFINWQMIGAIFVLLVAWLFLSQWIRITVFVVAILLWLNVLMRDQVSPCGLPVNRRHCNNDGWVTQRQPLPRRVAHR